MPVETSWYVDKRVIYTRFYGDLTIEALAANGDHIHALTLEGEAPMFLMLDMRQAAKKAIDFNQILSMMSKFRSKHNPIKWTIVLSDNALFNFFSTLASRVIDIPVRVFKNQADADTFISRLAPDIAPDIFTRNEIN